MDPARTSEPSSSIESSTEPDIAAPTDDAFEVDESSIITEPIPIPVDDMIITQRRFPRGTTPPQRPSSEEVAARLPAWSYGALALIFVSLAVPFCLALNDYVAGLALAAVLVVAWYGFLVRARRDPR